MIVNPGRRRDELKFSRVDRKKHSDGVDLNAGLVRIDSFGHNGRAGGRGLTISDEYRYARYVGTLALNSNYSVLIVQPTVADILTLFSIASTKVCHSMPNW